MSADFSTALAASFAVRVRAQQGLLIALAAVAVTGASAAGASTTLLQERAGEVRYAIPAAVAYQMDHDTWRGMTIAKLSRDYYRIAHVTVRRASRIGFCIESTRAPFVHFDGPSGSVRRGHCGTSGAVVPYIPKPTTTPRQTPAELRIRAAVPAIEAYDTDHRGYAGMTLAALRRYDPTVKGITIVRATRTTYCVESGRGSSRYHKNGLGAETARGACPRR